MSGSCRFFLFFSAALMAGSVSSAQLIGQGRDLDEGFRFEVYGGVGEISSLSGSATEQEITGGLNVDLKELNLGDDTQSWFWGLRATNRWMTLLADYRSSTVDASGTTESEVRLNVDSLSFGGASLDYLRLPIGTDYDIEAETNWLGLGIRATPFTVFPESRIQFTPWIHLGVQFIETTYDIDAGVTVGLDSFGLDRVYARGGQAAGKEEAGIPEYGIGGEVRIRFGDKPRSAELVGQMTYKLLDFQGAIDSIGVDGDEFEDIDFTYTALETNIFLVYPLNDSVDLLGGLYIEQVDASATLDSRPDVGSFDREVDLSYTLYGLRAGLRF